MQGLNILNCVEVDLFDRVALFSESRIKDEDVPKGYYKYDIRHADEDDGVPATLEKRVQINYYGTVIVKDEIDLQGLFYKEIGDDDFGFHNEDGALHKDFAEIYKQYNNSLKPNKVNAKNELFQKQGFGYPEIEPVLYHEKMVDFNTVPECLQVLYAYMGGNGLHLYLPGKTIPKMPFMGTYLSIKKENSLLKTSRGKTTIPLRELSAEQNKITMQEYMQENCLSGKATQKRKKEEAQR